MSLFKIAWRSIRHRALSSTLTGLSMALGVSLVVAVLVIHGVVQRYFSSSAQGYDMLVGGKGGRLELVLNTVFHIGKPIEPIPYTYYKEFLPDRFRGHRVEGVSAKRFAGDATSGKTFSFTTGRNLRDDAPTEAVVGATAAIVTGLEVGDTFTPIRAFPTVGVAPAEFTVVGILDRANASDDEAIFVNVLGFKETGREGRFARQVAFAVPVCLGDSYDEFRVVATTSDMFRRIEYAPGTRYEFSDGGNFDDEHFFEAVIGSIVARRTGLKVGDTFRPTHGVVEDPAEGHDHDPFTVAGILAPTGTPTDRGLFINIEGFYLLEDHAKPVEEGGAGVARGEGRVASDEPAHADHGDAHEHEHDAQAGHSEEVHEEHDAHEGEAHEDHAEAGHDEEQHEEGHEHAEDEEEHAHDNHDHAAEDGHEHDGHDHDGHEHSGHEHEGHHHHEPLPENQREVTAILVRTNSLIAGMSLPPTINEGPVAQAVLPIGEIEMLFQGIVRNVQYLLLALAVLIVVVAGIGIMVSIYNSMSERRREIGIMRALGAGRESVMWIILFESMLLAIGGGLAGVLLGHGLIGLLSPAIVAQTGVTLSPFDVSSYELALIPALILLASLVGFVPAMSAYRTDVAKALGSGVQ